MSAAEQTDDAKDDSSYMVLLNSIATDLDNLLLDLYDAFPADNSVPQNSGAKLFEQFVSGVADDDGESSMSDAQDLDTRGCCESVFSADEEQQLITNTNNVEQWSQLVPVRADDTGDIMSGPQNREITLMERLVATHPIWYIPNIGRAGAVSLLKTRSAGTFIVRNSSQHNSVCLSVKLPPSDTYPIEHYLIELHGDKGLKLEGSHYYFKAIPVLLEYYITYCEELPCQLVLPTAVMEAELAQELTSLALLGQDFWNSNFVSTNPKGPSQSSIIRKSQPSIKNNKSKGDSKPPYQSNADSVQLPSNGESISQEIACNANKIRSASGVSTCNSDLVKSSETVNIEKCDKPAVIHDKFITRANITLGPSSRTDIAYHHPQQYFLTAPNASIKQRTKTDITSPSNIRLVPAYSDGCKHNAQLTAATSKCSKTISNSSKQYKHTNSASGGCLKESKPSLSTFPHTTVYTKDASQHLSPNTLLPPHEGYFQGDLTDKLSDYEDLWISPSASGKKKKSRLNHTIPGARKGETQIDNGSGNLLSKTKNRTIERKKRNPSYRSEITIGVSPSPSKIPPVVFTFDLTSGTLDSVQQDLVVTDAISKQISKQQEEIKERNRVPVDTVLVGKSGSKHFVRKVSKPTGHFRDRLPSSPAYAEPIDSLSIERNMPCSQLQTVSTQTGSSLECIRDSDVIEPFPKLHCVSPELIALGAAQNYRVRPRSSSSVASGDDSGVMDSLLDLENGIDMKTVPLGKSLFGPISRSSSLRDPPKTHSESDATSKSSTLPPFPKLDAERCKNAIREIGKLQSHKQQVDRNSPDDNVLHFEDTFFALEEYNEKCIRKDNKFPMLDERSTRSSADWSTVEDYIRAQSPELTIKPQGKLTMRNLQRLSTYDNVPETGARTRTPTVYSATSVGTVFCKPWDSNLWDDLINLGETAHQPRLEDTNFEVIHDSERIGVDNKLPSFENENIDEKIKVVSSIKRNETTVTSNNNGSYKDEESKTQSVRKGLESGTFGLPAGILPKNNSFATMSSIDCWDRDFVPDATEAGYDTDCFVDFADEESVYSWTCVNKDEDEVNEQNEHENHNATIQSQTSQQHFQLKHHSQLEIVASNHTKPVEVENKQSVPPQIPIITINVVDDAQSLPIKEDSSVDPSPKDERPRVASFSERLMPLLSAPRLLSIRQKKRDPCIRIRDYIYSLSKDKSTTFGQAIENFIQCTEEGNETNPSIVMRNVRQFMSGMKNYLVTTGEGDLENVIDVERNKLESDEFLNIDAIIEGALHKCVIRPLKQHIYTLFVGQYTKNGNLKVLSENIKYASTKSAEDMGIKPGLKPPTGTSMEVIKHFLNKMQTAYSPLKKLENLLSATASIYNNAQDNFTVNQMEGHALGAEDFLPMFIYVLVQCGLVSAEIECEYIWGLLHPSLLTGEAGYYLTTLSSAIHVLKNFQTTYEAATLRKTTNLICKEPHPCISDLQGFMKIIIPDEGQESIMVKTLPVRPNMPSKEVCNMIAHKFKITNPQDYGLYIVIQGAETQLNDNQCPQNMKHDLMNQKKHCSFAFKRKGTHFAWPKSLTSS